MGVLERDWAREDTRRREALPHVPPPRGSAGVRPQRRPGSLCSEAPLSHAEALAWLIFLLGLALLFGSLLMGFGGLVLGMIPGGAPVPDWMFFCVMAGLVLGVLGGVPAGVMAKVREEREAPHN